MASFSKGGVILKVFIFADPTNSTKATAEINRYYLGFRTPLATLFRDPKALILKHGQNEECVLVCTYKGNVLNHQDTPEKAGMQTNDQVKCYVPFQFRVVHAVRSPVIIPLPPWSPFSDLMAEYARITGCKDRIFYKCDGEPVGEYAWISSFNRKCTTLVAYTYKSEFPLLTDLRSDPEQRVTDMANTVVSPNVAVPVWRRYVGKMEAARSERRIQQWSAEDDANMIVHFALLRFLEWRAAVRVCANVVQVDYSVWSPPPRVDSTMQVCGADTELETTYIFELEDALGSWRTELVHEWEDLHESPEVDLPTSLLREAIIIRLLEVLAIAWNDRISDNRGSLPDTMIYTDGILYDPAFSDVVKEKCNAVERLSMKEIMKIWKGDQQQRRPKGVHANALRVRVRTRRDEIEEQWNNAASEAGAARIEFVNEIDDEEVPPNIGGLFLYLESSYRFEAGVNPKISPLTGCHCGGVSRCSQRTCHRKSSRNSVRYRPEYDRDLFDLGVDSPVIECNTLCSCSPDCANRVAQRPRTIPIQIFKTEERGWGARATVAIAKGTMVGIYTGLVIRREESEALPGFRIAYCFDLNALESRLEEAPENSYTVDAFSCGNWTRFINHCCEPNLRIIPVFYDTVPQDNLPYLAFMATRNICAYTELTFDYNPADQQAWEHKKFKEKGRAKKKRGKTQTQCRCGAENCRGWLSIPKA